MKPIICFLLMATFMFPSFSQNKAQWISSSKSSQWNVRSPISITTATGRADLVINTDKPLQVIDGFGTCFNELGWTSLSLLPVKDRDSIFRELFAPGVGACFNLCRMPVGANDFSRAWYSYDETPGDFDMKHFSIDNDLQTLVPFIKKAQQYNPALQLWASPWSPPTWMKYNQHYAARSVLGNIDFKSEEFGMDLTGINNGLPADKEGKEGTDMFIQQEKYFKAYARYFTKFIEAYRDQQVNISMVMPQNEFNSAQVFPSCTWTVEGLSKFLAYLGPQMKRLNVSVFFGTMERANEKLVDTILTDPQCKNYIKGIGFQWAGKGAIAGLHQRYPSLRCYQTEQECGNGKNDWQYCLYAWDLMKHYISNGANAYMYWNTSLKQGGISTWGWKQNSLISVDTVGHSFHYNYEYYLLKHVSHFVKPGARFVPATGYNDVLAFVNPDKTVVVVVRNREDKDIPLRIQVGAKMINPVLKAGSFNSFVLQ